MGLSSAALADILYYQRRGRDIRDYVARSLLDRERPLTVVGHSLGGVVLVDLLSSGSAPPVDRLVTVGSQAPLFYAIDALEHLRPGAGPEPFTPWLNIYNEADLLSFCAERVFPGTERIRRRLRRRPRALPGVTQRLLGGRRGVRRDQGAVALRGSAHDSPSRLFAIQRDSSPHRRCRQVQRSRPSGKT